MQSYENKSIRTDDWGEPEDKDLVDFVTEDARTKDIAKAFASGFLALAFTIGGAVGTAYLMTDKHSEQTQKIKQGNIQNESVPNQNKSFRLP